MTEDEIYALAIEARFCEYELDDGTRNSFDPRYIRFAKLMFEKGFMEGYNKACLEFEGVDEDD